MAQKCTLCNEQIEEEFGKMNGTILKVKDERGKNKFIPVCSICQKKDNWIDDAKVKGA